MKNGLSSFEEALRFVLDLAPAPVAEAVSLEEATGRILARDIRADRDIPPFDRSALDGYAVRVRGSFGARRRLPVAGEVAAGDPPPRSLKEGTCVRIWTGAAVPRGSQGVIAIEKAMESNGWVELEGPLEPQPAGDRGVRRRQGIAERGEDARRGALLARRGERITPGRSAVLAAVGMSEVQVYSELDLAIAVTGHEIVAPDRRPAREQIRSANDALVAAIARSAGVRRIRRLGIADDNERDVRRMILRGFKHELLVVTGGVSAGRLDLVPAVLRDLGVRILVHKVAMRPGRPFLFGVMEHRSRLRTPRGTAVRTQRAAGARAGDRSRTFVFGLPGNPVSVLATAVEFLVPFLRASRGDTREEAGRIPVRTVRSIRRGGGLMHFVPCVVSVDSSGSLWAREVRIMGSGDFVSASRANAFLRVPGDGRERRSGSLLAADPIPGAGWSCGPRSAVAKRTVAAARTRRAKEEE
jgi:molybdopterin molybdotransferase